MSLNIDIATLDFSKIEAGKLQPEAVDFGLRAAVEETVAALSVQAARAGLKLTAAVAPDAPDDLNGDPGRLRQVLYNLVGNAVKFTPSGEVAVTVTRGERQEEGGGFRGQGSGGRREGT